MYFLVNNLIHFEKDLVLYSIYIPIYSLNLYNLLHSINSSIVHLDKQVIEMFCLNEEDHKAIQSSRASSIQQRSLDI
jgi:hypothetical protein